VARAIGLRAGTIFGRGALVLDGGSIAASAVRLGARDAGERAMSER
jgi:hypothetical protein